jgi:hypothetical protein
VDAREEIGLQLVMDIPAGGGLSGLPLPIAAFIAGLISFFVAMRATLSST